MAMFTSILLVYQRVDGSWEIHLDTGHGNPRCEEASRSGHGSWGRVNQAHYRYKKLCTV